MDTAVQRAFICASSSFQSFRSSVETRFDRDSNLAEITMRFTGELTSVVKDRDGQIIEGSPTSVKRQKDSWTFARTMGSDDPNWLLVATDG